MCTSHGKPAPGLTVTLEHLQGAHTSIVVTTTTDDDGRIRELAVYPTAGTYRLTFDVAAYLASGGGGGAGFYPYVTIVFTVRDAAQHHHVPLLLSPYGYSTYRGS